jgi:hypothetical protein
LKRDQNYNQFNKLSLKKKLLENRKTLSFLFCIWTWQGKSARGLLARDVPLRPGRNLGLGRESLPPPGLLSAHSVAGLSRSSDSIRRSSAIHAGSKPPAGSFPRNPNFHFFPPSFSLTRSEPAAAMAAGGARRRRGPPFTSAQCRRSIFLSAPALLSA